MEADPLGEERTCSRYECRFSCAVTIACLSVVSGVVGVYAFLVDSQVNAALSLSIAVAVVFIISLFFAIYYKRRMPSLRVVSPDFPGEDEQAIQLEMMVNGGNELPNVDDENASTSSSDNVAVLPDPPCLQPPEQLPSAEPSCSSEESSDRTSGPESLRSEEPSNPPAPVPGTSSATLPDAASAACASGNVQSPSSSKCATGKEVETQTTSAGNQTSSGDSLSAENEAEQSDSSEIRCRKRSQESFPGD